MENRLYDELLQEIFQKIPPSSSSSVALVCKRWLRLYRSSTTSLSLRFTPLSSVTIPSLSSFLSHHPFLSSLSISLSPPCSLSPHILSLISSSCSNLLALSLTPTPLSLSSLLSLSTSFPRLTSLSITLPRPVHLNWVPSFPCLKQLSISLSSGEGNPGGVNSGEESEEFDAELGLESLCVVGINSDDWGMGWLWRRCTKLKKLKLQSCQGIGGPSSSFAKCLHGIHEIELRTCRSVVYGVLLELVEHCDSLNFLLVHDGGSREGLLEFLTQCRSKVSKFDLRLPLDLHNGHLLAMAANFNKLTSLRLQSCSLVTGKGLKAVAGACDGLEELALVNCDVVEREPGLLATLGQHLWRLRKLDLSHNEMLLDKEFVYMLASCIRLIDLKVRGCKGLTSVAVVFMLKSCRNLQNVDIMNCSGIHSGAIELFVKNSCRLRRMEVEGSKLSVAAKMWASRKFIEVVV